MNRLTPPITLLALVVLLAATGPMLADRAPQAQASAQETTRNAAEQAPIRLAWDRVGAVA